MCSSTHCISFDYNIIFCQLIECRFSCGFSGGLIAFEYSSRQCLRSNVNIVIMFSTRLSGAIDIFSLENIKLRSLHGECCLKTTWRWIYSGWHLKVMTHPGDINPGDINPGDVLSKKSTSGDALKQPSPWNHDLTFFQSTYSSLPMIALWTGWLCYYFAPKIACYSTHL